MPDYRKIMLLLLQGRSYRQVQSILNCSPRAVSRARQVLQEQELSTSTQILALSEEDLDQLFTDGRKAVSTQFVPIDIDGVIKARIGRKKPALKVLWAQYLKIPPVGSQRHYQYERFCQIVAEHARRRDLTSPLSHEPGHTMQVDWAGTKMRLVDPITGLVTKVSVFVASLPYSGITFAHGYLDEKLAAWCDAHRRAFEYMQGVAQVVIPDNASTASNTISRYENVREVNQSYAAFLEYYQSAAVPTDVYKPQYKGHVESGVRVVTNWVIHFLEDRRFTTLDELNDAIATQVEWINERTPFRGEPRSRRDWFEDLEREALIELPAQRWQQVDWRKAKVSRDWHVQVDTIKYSVPFGYVGRTLEVRIAGEQVAILADGQIVAEHQRGARRHSYVTDQQHAPDGYQDTSLLWTRAYFVRQANKVGPGTVQALNRLLDQKKIEAQGFRACMNILGLGKGPNRHLLERACQELCADPRTGISYTAVKHRITLLRAANNQRPTTSGTRDTADLKASSVPAPSQRDTSSAHLAGISAFSLQALTGESAASASTDQEDGNV